MFNWILVSEGLDEYIYEWSQQFMTQIEQFNHKLDALQTNN